MRLWRDKAAAAADRRNPVQSTRRDQHLPPPARQTFYDERQQSDCGSRPRGRRGFGDSRGGRGRGNPNPRRYDLLPPPQCITTQVSDNCVNVEFGARFRSFSNHWRTVTYDPWVLDTVANGLIINFLSDRFQRAAPRDVAMSSEMRAVCQDEICSLLKKRAIEEITEGSAGFICSFFCVPKKMEGFRSIVNLKPLNKFIKYEHFKMEDLETVLFLVRKGGWFIKLDLKDAYLTVPVHTAQP
ncbi:Uncharacterized protein APZ42_008524, partial [Daphnia magna]